MLCDCELTRIVITADGTPVDLGRTQRLYTGPQRRAIIVRDQVCAWGACGRAARWCEVHHIRWWDRDLGRTSVDNGLLLCTFHHHEVHRRNLTITRTGLRGIPGARIGAGARAAYTFTTPDGRVIAGPPPAQPPDPPPVQPPDQRSRHLPAPDAGHHPPPPTRHDPPTAPAPTPHPRLRLQPRLRRDLIAPRPRRPVGHTHRCPPPTGSPPTPARPRPRPPAAHDAADLFVMANTDPAPPW